MAKRIGKPIWLQEWQKIHGSGNKKYGPEVIEKIKKMYEEEKLSMLEISKKLNIKQPVIFKLMKKNGIKSRSLKEARALSKTAGKGLNKWREANGSWCKGLTKDNPKMKALIKKGQKTQIKNGKSKGKNNPMYGRVANGKTGFRKDLNHSVRSTWEANFARILKYLKLEYEYEKYTFPLKGNKTYTPDFYIIKKSKFYEIKGYEYNQKHHKFKKEYPDKKLTIINEKFYNRLIKAFHGKINLEDNNQFLTKQDITNRFLAYYKKTDATPNVQKFCKELGISHRTVINLFNSLSHLVKENAQNIKNIDLIRLKQKYNEYNEKFKTHPSKKKFYKYYKRASTLIKNYFDNKYLLFVQFARA